MARRRIEFETDLIAFCRRIDDEASVLLVEESSPKRPAKVVDHFTCSAASLEERLLEARCGRLVAMLPSTATLVRTVHVPAGSALQVESAIRIEAEARLLGSAPAHRSGLGLISLEGPTPTGLVVAWPEALDPDLPEMTSEIDVTWVPEIACLALLAGDAPTTLTAVIDADGSTSAVVPTPYGPVFRATRGDSSRPAESRLRPLVAESLLGVNVDPGSIEQTVARLVEDVDRHLIGDSLLLPADADATIQPLIDRPLDDLTDLDPASARLLVAARGVARGDNAELAGLRRYEHREKPTFLGAVANRLSDGRTAVTIATIALLLLIISPLAFSGLRLMIMRGKVDDLGSLEDRVRRVENLKKVYEELDQQAWSVTKLLGDISNLMPEQIELVSVTLTHGEPVTVTGVAKRDADMTGFDIVFDFNRRLRSSGVFLNEGPRPSIEQPDARGYSEFKVTAEVADPLRQIRPNPEDDYAVLTYRDRRYGPVDDDGYLIIDPTARQERIDSMIARGIDLTASLPPAQAKVDSSSRARAETPSAPPPRRSSEAPKDSGEDVASAPPSRDRSEARSRDRDDARSRERSSTSGRARDTARNSGQSAPASRDSIRTRVIEIPETMSSEEIKTLSNAEAKARLAKIAGARNAPNATDEQKQAMKMEWDILLNHIRETNP
jgi:Tfp pilus assembly protein PilN